MSRRSEDQADAAARWQAHFAQYTARRRELYLRMSELLQTWQGCRRKPCRRGRRCAGPDIYECFIDWWDAHVSNDMRTILHAWVMARVAGASVAEADAASDAMEARIEAFRAKEAADAAEAAEARLAPAASSPRISPGRCRTL